VRETGVVARRLQHDRLEHVFWIGGGSAAGKSTVAQRLAEQRGLQVYPTDDAMSGHAAELTPDEAPLLADFRTMTMDEPWVDRSPQVMLDTFHWFRGEGFGLIVDDLLRMPPSPPVVLEGFRLLGLQALDVDIGMTPDDLGTRVAGLLQV
jgi:hypothetical protein